MKTIKQQTEGNEGNEVNNLALRPSRSSVHHFRKDESGSHEARKGILERGNGAPAVFLCLLIACTVTMCCAGCAEFKSGAYDVATILAKDAVVAVAQHYGGDDAAQLASAGLSATAEVLQGYVNGQPPIKVAETSPGVKGVGQVVVGYLKTKGWVTQDTVDKIHSAAAIAANATEKKK